MSLPKVAVIVGPTASGKSALAVRLAKKFKGEIISADSRQVYHGMDIGTGKITGAEMEGVPHHLLDVADPRRTFTVSQYQKLAYQKIREILKRNRLPIIVGGTGFYIQAVVDGLSLPRVQPNHKLRAQLGKKKPPELFAILRQLDPRRARAIDQHNPHRLIRAIEIATALGQVPKIKTAPPPYDFIQLGIKTKPSQLNQNIHRRLLARYRQGLVAEIKRLRQAGVNQKRLDSFGLEYKLFADREKLERAIRRYAKRQLTWFKRDQRIRWVKNYSAAAQILHSWLSERPVSQAVQARRQPKRERKKRRSAARRKDQPQRP